LWPVGDSQRTRHLSLRGPPVCGPLRDGIADTIPTEVDIGPVACAS